MSLPDGTKELKRVRFSRRRFSERQAENWWSENRARVFEQYNVRGFDKPMNEDTVQSMPVNEDKVASPHQL
jgi:mannose-6-phosphate isomerase-like protein (cupin superfamily)